MNTTEKRKKDLAKIHIACTSLGLSKDDRACIIASLTGGRKHSAAELNQKERGLLLAHFKRKGWRPVIKNKTNQRPPLPISADSPEAKKVRALWLFLHELGEVRDPSERALASYCKRVTGADLLQWTSALHKLIEGLKSWAMRVLPKRVAAMQNSIKNRPPLPTDITDKINDAIFALRAAQGEHLFNQYHALYEALKAAQTHLKETQNVKT